MAPADTAIGRALHRDRSGPARLRSERQTPRRLRQAHHGLRCARTGQVPRARANHPRRPRPRRAGRPSYGLDYPDEVERIAFLDIIPTRETFRRTDASLARGYWHWFFHLQPDLPELLVGPNIEGYLRYFFERWSYNRAAFDQDTIAEYVRAFSAPGALRAGFDDYRAFLPGRPGSR